MLHVELDLPICITKEDDTYVAICPIFNVASQGKTENEATSNVIEALELFLEDEDVQKEFKKEIAEHIERITPANELNTHVIPETTHEPYSVKVGFYDRAEITDLIGA